MIKVMLDIPWTSNQKINIMNKFVLLKNKS